MTVEAGSFRDPSGQVFIHENTIYRSIYQSGIADYKAACNNGIYEELILKKQLISHSEVSFEHALENTEYCIEHPKLPMVSYPWEWSFSMLKDAALLHLDIMEFLLPKGFWLRDASAFNVQYNQTGLLLIDTLSIGKKAPDSPWVAYNQFCSHFLAPLATASCCDIRTLGLWRNYIDGFPLDLAVKMLPVIKKYSPGLFMHLTLHAYFQRKSDRQEDILKEKTSKKRRVSDLALLGIIRSLRKTINKLKWDVDSRIWANYESIRTYEDADVKEKANYVKKIVNATNPAMVWDLGGNTGEFSKIAAESGAFVVSIDGDPACTEFIYKNIKSTENGKRILPLTMDLANPSPGLGWESKERLSIIERGPADLILALALIHHLVFSANIPLTRIAKWFASLSNNLLVEFMPIEDPMIKKLTQNRQEHLSYSLEDFKTSFSKYFTFIEYKELENKRILFHCIARKNNKYN